MKNNKNNRIGKLVCVGENEYPIAVILGRTDLSASFDDWKYMKLHSFGDDTMLSYYGYELFESEIVRETDTEVIVSW